MIKLTKQSNDIRLVIAIIEIIHAAYNYVDLNCFVIILERYILYYIQRIILYTTFIMKVCCCISTPYIDNSVFKKIKLFNEIYLVQLFYYFHLHKRNHFYVYSILFLSQVTV